MTIRASSSTAYTGESAASSTPTMNTLAVMMIVLRRPIASATRPAPSAPAAAPTSSRLVTSSCWNELNPPKSFLRNSSAPETTPVS